MPAKPKSAGQVIPLFQPALDRDVAEEVAVGRSLLRTTDNAAEGAGRAADLTGLPKILMLIGPGNVGKTTLARWMIEVMLTREGQATIAAVDPENRSLKDYFREFGTVHEPPSFLPAGVLQWLENFLGYAMENHGSAVIDFGGGDTSLAQLVENTPNLTETLEEAGVTPAALYVVGPRVDDLSPLATFERSGFRPKATAIVLNEGVADPILPREEAFAAILRHSAYRAAVDRGAATLWMPRLIPAREVEIRRILFWQARDAIEPEGRKVAPLGPFDRERVRRWLLAMDAAFRPIESWIP
jgi:hypothetical protein